MKITKRQIRRIIKEEFDHRNMSEYGLYEKPGAAEAEAAFDDLMSEVDGFIIQARGRLNALIDKYTHLGSNDTESIEMIHAAFEKAMAGKRE